MTFIEHNRRDRSSHHDIMINWATMLCTNQRLLLFSLSCPSTNHQSRHLKHSTHFNRETSLVKWGSQVNMIPKTVRVQSVGLHLLNFPWKIILGINLFYKCCIFSIFTEIKCNYHVASEEALKVIRFNIHSTRNGEKIFLLWSGSLEQPQPTTQKKHKK